MEDPTAEELFQQSVDLSRKSGQLIRLIRQKERVEEFDLPTLYAELTTTCEKLAEISKKHTEKIKGEKLTKA